MDIWARETAAAIKRVAPSSRGVKRLAARVGKDLGGGGGGGGGRTTNLRRSIFGRGAIVGGMPTAIIRAPVMYAPFVEFGTHPHLIFPRRRKALRWIGNTGSFTPLLAMKRKGQIVGTRFGKTQQMHGYIFAKGVRHPGTAPHPFFFNTCKARYKYLPRDVRKALRQQGRSTGPGFILTG